MIIYKHVKSGVAEAVLWIAVHQVFTLGGESASASLKTPVVPAPEKHASGL